MKVACREQMNKLDEESIKYYQIPSLLLMERAAYKVFEYLITLPDEKVIICCGGGNNGGDGLALASQLFLWSNKEVKVILLAEPKGLSQDATTYYAMCKALGIAMFSYEGNVEVCHEFIKEADILVDALFGTGLSKKIIGKYEEVIGQINDCKKAHKVSIDIPSGIACDTGKVLGSAVQADVTITFECLKVGICIFPGILYAGKVKVVDIGIPSELKEKMSTKIETIDEKTWELNLPPRQFRSNKGTYGKALIIGGAKGMAGAITLAAKACMKIGAGLVSVAVPECVYPIVEQSIWEVMTIGCKDRNGYLSEGAVEEIKAQLKKCDVIGMGPGIGRVSAIEKIIQVVLEEDKPCVIDADGLYAIKPYLDKLKNRRAATILTPHPGELSYLIDKPINEIMENSLTICESFAKKYKVTLVLKLERTIVATEDKLFINRTGNSGLAKGGSGDVLTGIIVGLLAQGANSLEAAKMGVYGHGKAADLMIQSKGSYALLPTDLYEGIEKLFIY